MEPTHNTNRQDNNLLFQSADAFPQLPVLPHELIKTIFSNLSNVDIQDASSASKLWNTEIMDYVKQEVKQEVQLLEFFILNNLDAKIYDKEINALKTVMEETKILDSANLLNVKSSTISFEKKIINILKKVSNDELIQLNKIFQEKNKNSQFENIFNLAQVYKDFEKLEKNHRGKINYASDFVRPGTILQNLVKCGHLDEALSILDKVEDLFARRQIFLDVVRAVRDKYKIMSEHNQYDAKQHYCDSFKIISNSSKGPIQTAIYTSKEIQYPVLCYLSHNLFKHGQLVKAIQLISKFDQDKDSILSKMAFNELSQNPGNIKVLDIVEEIYCPYKKDAILYKLNQQKTVPNII